MANAIMTKCEFYIAQKVVPKTSTKMHITSKNIINNHSTMMSTIV